MEPTAARLANIDPECWGQVIATMYPDEATLLVDFLRTYVGDEIADDVAACRSDI